jgi:mannose-6-phosphate isomerase-like protein (cupin superfamily)
MRWPMPIRSTRRKNQTPPQARGFVIQRHRNVLPALRVLWEGTGAQRNVFLPFIGSRHPPPHTYRSRARWIVLSGEESPQMEQRSFESACG